MYKKNSLLNIDFNFIKHNFLNTFKRDKFYKKNMFIFNSLYKTIFFVYNGKKHVKCIILRNVLGINLGELCLTKRLTKKIHSIIKK